MPGKRGKEEEEEEEGDEDEEEEKPGFVSTLKILSAKIVEVYIYYIHL